MKQGLLMACVWGASLLSSCVPYPTSSVRTRAVSGRILDADTREPLSGARVSLHDAPDLRATTAREDGTFLLSETKNMSLVLYLSPCSPDTNVLKPLGNAIDIRCDGYRPRLLDEADLRRLDKPHMNEGDGYLLKDVLLMRR